MASPVKVFGVGMSKTGTTTLGECLEILGFTPHISFEPQLKTWLESGGDIERILKVAEKYRALEDSPWYHVFEQLDQRFPGSKFVLTVRKNSLVHAKSSWAHGVRGGLRTGDPAPEYIAEKIAVYESHNQRVMDYFKDRPQDLLVMCWENGDGWEKLCSFLNVSVPSQPIPHANQGRYKARFPKLIANSKPYTAVVRALHSVIRSPMATRLKRALSV